MATTMEISYKTKKLVLLGSQPTAQEQDFTNFVELSKLFPGIHFLRSTTVGSAPPKNLGEDLPGRQGIVNFYSPVTQKTKRLTFLCRNVNNESGTREQIKNFVSWLYSIGEFRVSFNSESQYRRMIYNSGQDYDMFFGTYGYDAEFSLDFTCLDSISYSRSYTQVPMQYQANYSSAWDRYWLYSSTSDRDTLTLDYTPAIIKLSFVSGTLSGEQRFVMTFDGVITYFLSLDFGTPGISAFFDLYIDGERSEVYYMRGGNKTSLVDAIIGADSYFPTGYERYSRGPAFPTVMYSDTYLALYTTRSSTAPVPIVATGTVSWRRQVLAYD